MNLAAAIGLAALLGCGASRAPGSVDAGDAGADRVQDSADGDGPAAADRAEGSGDTTQDSDGAPGEASSCKGDAGFWCAFSCSDLAAAAVCADGRWECPPGSADSSQCHGCFGALPPGCTCEEGVTTCRDGGADAQPDGTGVGG
jgi:hypothetical protein